MSDNIARAIGSRIKHMRQRLGMTADDLAERIGVSRQQVFKIEGGLTGITFQKLSVIARALAAEVHDLLPPSQEKPEGDYLQLALRGTGLSAAEVEKVLEYARMLRISRLQQGEAREKDDA